jgi:hypothetical protein
LKTLTVFGSFYSFGEESEGVINVQNVHSVALFFGHVPVHKDGRCKKRKHKLAGVHIHGGDV